MQGRQLHSVRGEQQLRQHGRRRGWDYRHRRPRGRLLLAGAARLLQQQPVRGERLLFVVRGERGWSTGEASWLDDMQGERRIHGSSHRRVSSFTPPLLSTISTAVVSQRNPPSSMGYNNPSDFPFPVLQCIPFLLPKHGFGFKYLLISHTYPLFPTSQTPPKSHLTLENRSPPSIPAGLRLPRSISPPQQPPPLLVFAVAITHHHHLLLAAAASPSRRLLAAAASPSRRRQKEKMADVRIFCHADLQALQDRSDPCILVELVSLESMRIASDSCALLVNLIEGRNQCPKPVASKLTFVHCHQIDILSLIAGVALELQKMKHDLYPPLVFQEAKLDWGFLKNLLLLKNSAVKLVRLAVEAKETIEGCERDLLIWTLGKVKEVGEDVEKTADLVLKGTHNIAWLQERLPFVLDPVDRLLSTPVHFPGPFE